MTVKPNDKVKDALNRQLHKRMRRDRNAAWLINFGGWLVLATLVVLLWHLISVVLPMFSSPQVVLLDERRLQRHDQRIPGDMLYQTQIQDQTLLIARAPDCSVNFYRQTGIEAPMNRIKRIPFSCGIALNIAQFEGFSYLWQLSEQGLLRVSQMTILEDEVFLRHTYSTLLPDLIRGNASAMLVNMGSQRWTLAFNETSEGQIFWLDPSNQHPPKKQYFAELEHLKILPDNSGVLVAQGALIQQISPAGEVMWQHQFARPISHLTTSPSAKGFFVQLDGQALQKWGLVNDTGSVSYQPLFTVPGVSSVTQLLFRPQSMLGVLTTHTDLMLFNSSTGKILQTQAIAALTGSTANTANTHTTENQRTGMFSWQNNRLTWFKDNTLRLFAIEKSHANLTIDNLFGRIHYEGYNQADYLWQSTTSGDEGEAKYSVVPLLMGSVKASLLALLVALPLGLGAAVYTAYFAPARGRKWLKPTIELLEAIPSVVIGFIAVIWLLPLSEKILAGLLAFFLLIPLFALALLGVNPLLRRFVEPILNQLRGAQPSEKAVLLRLPLSLPFIFIYLLLFAALVSYLTPVVWQVLTQLQLPALFFDPERDTHGKNTIVIAIALGLAISPSIYSLAEDAIYEVPVSLRRASYALGATRLQTLLNVVLKVAYPSLLSAIMLGFSRALGETMILLMVTGNTPMAEWDLVAGMRTLTANLAIELPEAKVGSIHYQVLFLTALLLLMFTMVINTIAELLRLRLRKKYQYG